VLISVCFDLSKAFDTIDHTIMIDKLAKYGIRGVVRDWFIDYLSNRKQYVMLGNKDKSDMQDITCGVPQGSILGPLLFIIYINDIVDVSN
jgi:hypothetical protein